MEKLKVVSMNGQLVTDSRDVAEMIEREHKHLLRNIRSYIEILGKSKIGLTEFFIEGHYLDSQGKFRPRFFLTRKGCDMVANKLTGDKGVLFTAAYVDKFHEMEKQQPKVLTDKEQLMASMKLSIEHDEKIENHDNRITYLEDHMRVDGIQEKRLQNKAKAVAIESLGGTKSNAYKNMSRKVFSGIWRDFNNHFEIPRYGELPRKQYEDGMRFLGMWQPSTSLRFEIEELNRQIEGVI